MRKILGLVPAAAELECRPASVWMLSTSICSMLFLSFSLPKYKPCLGSWLSRWVNDWGFEYVMSQILQYFMLLLLRGQMFNFLSVFFPLSIKNGILVLLTFYECNHKMQVKGPCKIRAWLSNNTIAHEGIESMILKGSKEKLFEKKHLWVTDSTGYFFSRGFRCSV